ncbi:hypothetical protein ARMGADRAFT_941112 [Armillaria gallica]|uniref:hAT-like transposase RNase-H fold domain-containing protein n=1 Tax=Armillaria gallica TaxID=47427 RepID=A0A2H3D3Y1_ARMGA|nr:hypothetical protein ARMGADRAFT_941112 [Armillaria gallica]
MPEFRLLSKEWKIAEQLHNVLKILKDAMLLFSHSMPSLATVIPAMDHIDSVFTNQSLNQLYDPAIQASIGMAKKTLNRYYNVTDYSEVYHIAMVHLSYLLFLHPHHKLAYFWKIGWTPDWINTVYEIVQAEYEHKYKTQVVEEEDDPNKVEKAAPLVLVCY